MIFVRLAVQNALSSRFQPSAALPLIEQTM
jgi:hypothetical protein